MPASANGYVLRVPRNRRVALLDGIEQGGVIGEPVPKFDHNRTTPLLVLLAFTDTAITHIADGLKGRGGGTRQDLLKMSNVEALPTPVIFDSLVQSAPSSVRAPLSARLSQGGLLAPMSLGVTVDALIALQPNIAQRIARYSERRTRFVRGLGEAAKENLALQKESLNVALRIAGIDPDVVTNWIPPEGEPLKNYLDGVQAPPVREDLMVIADADIFPGLDLVEREVETATKVFSKGTVRLHVTMANRQPLEAQTGADLIYFNETYNSFVMVQYKAMRAETRRGPEWIHTYRPDAQLTEEIRRMDALNRTIDQIACTNTLAEYRLNSDPFYLKLCPNMNLNLDDRGLFPGIYLPLEYWKLLIEDPCTLGSRGGRAVGYENVQRKFNNTEFIQLVASGFIGSRLYQSEFIRSLITKVLASGKAVTLAIQERRAPIAPEPYEDEDPGEENLFGEQDL